MGRDYLAKDEEQEEGGIACGATGRTRDLDRQVGVNRTTFSMRLRIHSHKRGRGREPAVWSGRNGLHCIETNGSTHLAMSLLIWWTRQQDPCLKRAARR